MLCNPDAALNTDQHIGLLLWYNTNNTYNRAAGDLNEHYL